MKRNNKLYVTHENLERLESFLAAAKPSETTSALENEIGRAEVVRSEFIEPSVVTMNSQVKYRDEDTQRIHEVRLVFPQHADITQRKVSVLAPVGIALLGLSKGQTIEFQTPDGRTKRLKVLDVTYQPEAADRIDRLFEREEEPLAAA